MPISTEEYRLFSEWLKSHPLAVKCPLCLEKANWQTGEIVGLPIKSDDAYVIDDTGLHVRNVPVLQLVCSSCGYTAHLQAAQMGLPSR